VILDDVLAEHPFSADEYITRKQARSVLCLPLIKQSRLTGLLYLENNLASYVFTPKRISVLELLASQAAISLENALLYNDLQEREAKIRRLVDSNIIGVVIWDSNGQVIEANQAFLNIVGYAREDLASGQLRWTGLTPAEWHADDKQAIAELTATGTTQTREKEYFRKDGSRVSVLVGATTFSQGQNEGVAFVLDLTERKQALQQAFDEIKKSEDRLRLVIDSIPTLVWRTGPEGIPDFLNQPALDYTGLTLDQAETGWPRAFHPDDKKGMLVKWSAIRASGMPGGLEARLRRFDGEYRWFLLEAVPLRDESGNTVKWYGSCTDIEARKRAEEENKQAEDKLHRAQTELAHVTRVTTLGELTASIAHEVNQPLAAIVANAEACLRWLGRETPDLAAARRSAEWVINDANRASEVIRRVRALANKADVEKVSLDINTVVGEVIGLVQRELDSHRVSLRTDLAPALPVILADRVQLQQVIINLMMNAIEAMQPVTDRSCELVIRSGHEETNQIFVSVMDCGIGISAENANQLFGAFFTTKSDGLGMGLSICRSIVEAHGGRLSARCNDGPGATFQFTLPSHQENAS
jgi:PAS domain S-box-containing protein